MNELEISARGVVAAGFPEGPIDDRTALYGGYIAFARNCATPAALRAATDALRARTFDGVPPLIAIDQEGGRVARLRDGVEPMPSMMTLGAGGDVDPAVRGGEQTAFDLRRAGCTMNFAPSLDLAVDPGNTVIGTRSLGAEPAVVAALGEAYARGLERGGIVPCFKHFPGHGSTSTDSHQALPVVEEDETTLRARDLAPFAAVAANAPAIMGAHVLVRALDAQRPASLSARIARDLLRGEFGFRGAYVTDCLEMGAVAGLDDGIEPGVIALEAGADLLLVSHDGELAERLVRAIVHAVDSGTLPYERLREAYERVLRLRRIGAPPLPLDESPPHPGVGREIARRGITLVRGLAHADPLTSCAVDFTDGDGPNLSKEAPALVRLRFPLDPVDAGGVLETVARTGRRPIVLARRAHLHPAQADAIARLLDHFSDAVVVSMLEPFDLPLFERARHVLAAYGDDLAAIGGLADVLFGGSLPQGRLPVRVPLGV